QEHFPYRFSLTTFFLIGSVFFQPAFSFRFRQSRFRMGVEFIQDLLCRFGNPGGWLFHCDSFIDDVWTILIFTVEIVVMLSPNDNGVIVFMAGCFYTYNVT